MRLAKLYTTTGLFLVLILIITILIAKLQPSWQITGDGFGYYSYLHSVYFDHDLNFYNEYKYYDLNFNSHLIDAPLTPTHKLGNAFAVGLSLVWLPFFLLASFFDYFFLNTAGQLSGISLPYQIFLGLGSILYTLGGLLLLFQILKKFFTTRSAWIATLAIIFISPLPHYLIYEPHMSHGASLASIVLLFWLSTNLYRSTEKIKTRQLVCLGLGLGLTILLRWQNIIFWIVPLFILYQKKNKREIDWWYFFIPLLTAIICFLPQLIVWKILYGSFWVVPQGSGFIHWFQPKILQFLFSQFHGLFFWHPLLILGIVGLILSYKKNQTLFWMLLIPLLGQIYLNSTIKDWWAGQSFGSRRMIECLPIFAYGLTYLLDTIKKRWLVKIIIIFLSLGSVFNILVMIAAPRGYINLEKPTTPQQYYLAPLQMLKDKLK